MGAALFPADKRENGRTDLTRLTVAFVLRKRPKSATVAVALHGYKTRSLTLGKEYKLRAVENRLLKRTFEYQRLMLCNRHRMLLESGACGLELIRFRQISMVECCEHDSVLLAGSFLGNKPALNYSSTVPVIRSFPSPLKNCSKM
jgi:hypothetical protein